MQTSRRTTVTLAALGLSLALTACTGSGSDAGASPASASTSTAAESPSGAGSASSTGAGSATAAGLDITHLPTPMGTMTVPADVDSGAKTMKIDLLTVEKRDKLMYVTFAVTPTLVDPANGHPALHDAMNGAANEVQAVDPVGLKLYRTVRQPSSSTSCGLHCQLATNPHEVALSDGQPVFVYAYLPLPDAAKVDLMFNSSTPAFIGVPVPR